MLAREILFVEPLPESQIHFWLFAFNKCYGFPVFEFGG